MTEHTITAHETYWHIEELEFEDDEVKQISEKHEKVPNWRSLANYECSCGEEFNIRESAESHLERE